MTELNLGSFNFSCHSISFWLIWVSLVIKTLGYIFPDENEVGVINELGEMFLQVKPEYFLEWTLH